MSMLEASVEVCVKKVIVIELRSAEYRALDDACMIALHHSEWVSSEQREIVSDLLDACREEWAKE